MSDPIHSILSDDPDARWEAIGRVLADESDPAETAAVHAWLAAHPEDAELVALVKSRSERAATQAAVSVDTEAALAAVQRRLAAEPGARPELRVVRGEAPPKPRASSAPRLRMVRGVLLAVAAGLVAVVGVRQWRGGAPTAAAEYRTAVGQRDSVRLPDGSAIVLAPGSRLTVAANYGAAAREVTLEGAAHFVVEHDAAHPFIVHAGAAVIEDLGTAFSVKSAADGQIAVAVSHGIVALRDSASRSSAVAAGIELRAGDRGTLANGAVRVQRGVVTDDDMAWTRGQLAYRDTPLSEVRADLRRWYGLELRVTDPVLAARTLTASFRGDSSAQVIQLIALALGADSLTEARGRMPGRVVPHLQRSLRITWAASLLYAVPAWGASALRPALRSSEPICATRIASADRSALWATPLDRIISVKVADLPLREALDQVASEAKLELSYSSDMLPAGRRVCLTLQRVPVGAVLELLLGGSTLRPVVLGASQVVLAPSRPSATAATSVAPRQASVLDRVVVTGSPDGAAQRGSPFALDVIDGATLMQFGARTLGDALELASPGVWTWTASAGTVSARYGSIRGASSFGASAPKIYLDGIEVANPLLVTQLDAARVARVEIIRGPQGAALYGADAISGVVNILTRHDGTENGGLAVQLSTAAGVSSTAFAPRDVFVQDHALSLRSGSTSRSLGLGLNVGTVGAYVPGASEQRVLADAGLMFGSADPGAIPLRGPFAGDSATGQDLRQFTLGGSAAFMPSVRWTNTIIAGVDGFRLRGLSTIATAAPVQNTALASLSSTEGGADRWSLRLRSVGRFDIAPATLFTVTMAAEQAFTRERTTVGASLPMNGQPPRPLEQASVTWYDNSGVVAQGQLAWRDQWFLSAGARAERITGATPNAQSSLLPMLGSAWVREWGSSVLKLRAAYGRGIRPARTPLRTSLWIGRSQLQALEALEPESQDGTEVGADWLLGSRLTLQVTRFDQRATGLIQPVGAVVSTAGQGGRPPQRTMSYVMQNVGAITNRGWEMSGQTQWRPLTIAGSWAYVDSRVAQVAPGYRGELRPGDRMLDVPAHTLTVSASYLRGRWMVSSSASRAMNWIGYDRAAIGAALAAENAPRELDGPLLRRYWTRYDDVTRWRGSVAYRARGDLSLVLGGENLLNIQSGAPDNATVIAGRTLTLGLRTQF
jgi:ferric-dicitrate binding protein FerR (iron transport regulator)